MGRTSWLESACGPEGEGSDSGAPESGLSSSQVPGDLGLASPEAAAEASLEAMSEGRYTRWTRLALLLVALILLGLFACPPRTYARARFASCRGTPCTIS